MLKEEFLPGIKLRKGDITSRVLVCGDPQRAEKIADRLDQMKVIAKNREYWTFSGKYKGEPITVSSHGVGASGAIMSFIGLMKAGAKVIIRMGTAGGLSPEVQAGSLVIATAASKEDGVCNIYVPDSFPAVADVDVVNALSQSAKSNSLEAFRGIIVTQGAFYGGVKPTNTEEHAAAGAIALDMEVAALYIAGSMEKVKTGAVLTIDGNALSVLENAEGYAPDPDMLKEAIDKGIQVALDALIAVEI